MAHLEKMAVFDRKGIFLIEKESLKGMDVDDFTMEMIDGGAEDVEEDEDIVTVTTAMEDFGTAQSKLAELEIEPKESGLQRIANNFKALNEDHMPTFWKLIDALEDDDDVQKVYHNLEYSEEMAEA
jgi:transcriptional/translational regulatory protein YebC/TACO1